MALQKYQPPGSFRRLREAGQQLMNSPESRLLASGLGFGSSLLAVYEFFGLRGFSIGVTAAAIYYMHYAFRRMRHARYLEAALLNELPHQHAFFVEFLRQTYGFPGRRDISARNAGVLIHTYENNFIVNETDCRNVQSVHGSNISGVPVRSISFVLVGGSSIRSASLGAQFSVDDGPKREPEFVIDEDRLKVVSAAFETPLEPGSEFRLKYSDNWPGSMRREADGFFFPEALYFIDSIHRISSHVEFSFAVREVAVLEIELDEAIVKTCRTQPRACQAPPGMAHAYDWFVDSPSSSSVFVFYYRAAA
jgi:hypothetical protein